MPTIRLYALALLAASLVAAPARAEPPQVLADIAPVHSLVAQVMAGVAAPGLLLDRGADPHDFQLRPSQARALAGADLVVWVGAGLTPWLERPLAARAGGGAVLGLLEVPGTAVRLYADADAGSDGPDHDAAAHDDHDHAEGDHAEGDHAEDGHDDHADDAHHVGDGHDHGPADPHAWLDPANARLWLGAVADALAALDPDNAATYRANAEAGRAAVDAAEAAAAALLAPVRAAPIIVFHDGLGHFADHFGLNVVATLAEGDAAAPSAARLAAVRAAIAAHGAPCLFPEAGHDPRLIETMAQGTAARVGAPLDIAGALGEPGPALYPALLTGLARAIAACSGRG